MFDSRSHFQPPRRYLFAIMLVASLEFIQNGMLNFAASAVMGGIGAAPEEFSYAAMAYASTAIVVLFNHQRCSYWLGPRRFVQGSLLLFGLGAVLCACASTPAAFILGRAVQGLGGAVFFTAARVEVDRLQDKRKILGLLCFGYALMLGSAFGPLLGSQALRHLDWRWIFWGILPWLALALPATRLLSLRARRPRPSSSTPHALAWLAAAVLALQWLIQQTPYDFFGQAQQLLVILALCGMAALVAIRLQGGNARLVYSWRSLAQLRYVLGLFFYFCCYLLVSANSYILPVMVQQALGFDVPTSGQLLSVSFLAGMLFATVYAALLFRRRAPGLRIMLLIACALLAAYGLLMTSTIHPGMTLWQLTAILLLNGGFMSLFIMAVAQGTFREVRPAQFAHAYQTKNIIRQLAISMGVALSTVFLQARNALHYQRLSEGFSWHAPRFTEAMDHLQQLLPQLGQEQRLALLVGELVQQAMLLSCQDFFRLETGVAAVLVLIILLQRTFRE